MKRKTQPTPQQGCIHGGGVTRDKDGRGDTTHMHMHTSTTCRVCLLFRDALPVRYPSVLQRVGSIMTCTPDWHVPSLTLTNTVLFCARTVLTQPCKRTEVPTLDRATCWHVCKGFVENHRRSGRHGLNIWRHMEYQRVTKIFYAIFFWRV